MSAFTIDELRIPATLTAPEAADFISSMEVRNEVEAYEYGTTDTCFTPAEALPGYLDTEYSPKRLFVARTEGRIAARAVYERDAEEPDVAWMDLRVLPIFRHRGIGTALADVIEDLSRQDDRARVITYAVSSDAPGERLASPTGFGSLPLQKPEVQFLLKRQYSLEQVERGSRLALPVGEPLLQGKFAMATAAAGPDYALHFWAGRTPQCWLSDMAALFTSMSVEEPSAGLDEPPAVWTVQRVQDTEEREAGSSRTSLVAVVEHLPSHQLVGHNILSVPDGVDRPVAQEDTLVLPGHRGRRLGMLLKVANIMELQRSHPGHPAIITFNAEENRHMLDVNEAVGFVPIGYEGAWKKVLR